MMSFQLLHHFERVRLPYKYSTMLLHLTFARTCYIFAMIRGSQRFQFKTMAIQFIKFRPQSMFGQVIFARRFVEILFFLFLLLYHIDHFLIFILVIITIVFLFFYFDLSSQQPQHLLASFSLCIVLDYLARLAYNVLIFFFFGVEVQMDRFL